MPLGVVDRVDAGGGVSTGPALPNLPANAGQQISNAIGQLQTNDMFGAPGPTGVQNVFGWRIDRQNAPGNFVNLSVQRNGVVGAPSTVASVFVPVALHKGPGPGGPAAEPFHAQMSELIRNVRRGLEESFATYGPTPHGGAIITRKQVTGEFSA